MSPATPDPDRSADRADVTHPPPPATWAPDVPDGPAAPDGGEPAGAPGPDPAVAPDTGVVATGAPGNGLAAGEPAGEGAVAAGEPEAPVGRRVARATWVVLALTAAGVLLGLLWAALAPGTPVIRTADGAVYAEPQPEQPIAADGWFSLLGLGFGVLAALGIWFLLRRQRGPFDLLAAVLGCLGAAVVAWRLGRQIGLSTYERLLVTAPVGESFDKPVDLRAGGVDLLFGVLPVPYGDLLLPAFAAAVTYTLLAGWSRWPSLRPEPVEVSWVPAGAPAPAAAPEPPGPDAAGPTRG